MTLYNLRSPATITKFDADGNPEASYEVSHDACTCPAGSRPTCRHRQMLHDLLPIIDSIWFWDFDNRLVVDFTGVAANPTEYLPRLPSGVQVVDLNDPAELHNAIAEAIGEPVLPHPWRRL